MLQWEAAEIMLDVCKSLFSQQLQKTGSHEVAEDLTPG